MDDLKGLALRLRLHPGVLVLLAATATDGSAALVFARSDDRNEDMGRLLQASLAALGGKGGGRPELAQGQATKLDQLDELWKVTRGILDVG
jgi:alanyl-tRNA synthetase